VLFVQFEVEVIEDNVVAAETSVAETSSIAREGIEDNIVAAETSAAETSSMALELFGQKIMQKFPHKLKSSIQEVQRVKNRFRCIQVDVEPNHHGYIRKFTDLSNNGFPIARFF
jgi:hypothetical protein